MAIKPLSILEEEVGGESIISLVKDLRSKIDNTAPHLVQEKVVDIEEISTMLDWKSVKLL